MKRKVLLATLCFLFASICVLTYAGNAKAYAKDNARVRKLPLAKRRVVLLGNSITENWAKYSPRFFSSNGFVGRGISGQTTSDYLGRFDEDVLSIHPRVLVLNGGTNDIAENGGSYDPELTFRNIVWMAERAKSCGIKVALTSVLPAGKIPWNASVTGVMGKIQALNKRLRKYADDHQMVYVDYYELMVSDDGTQMKAGYADDGVHPTCAGYRVMEEVLMRSLRPYISRGEVSNLK